MYDAMLLQHHVGYNTGGRLVGTLRKRECWPVYFYITIRF